MSRSKHPLVLLGLSACLLASACGTQVDDGVRQQAAAAALSSDGGGGGQAVAGQEGAVDPATGEVVAVDPAAPGADPAAGGGGAAPTTPEGGTAPAAGGGSTSVPAAGGAKPAPGGAKAPAGGAAPQGAAAPAGGNGGATDVGVTPTQITIGTVADLSGPQPGLFQTSVNGTNAYISYVNSQGGIFGRKLKIAVADSQTSCEGDRNGHESLKDKVFAFSGSFSLFDSCGATVLAKNPTIPDVHLAVTPEANALPNNFSVNPIGDSVGNGVYEWATKKFGKDVVSKTAFMYVNLPAVNNVAKLQKKAAESAGWTFDYERAVGATETDFTADIIQMNRRGIKMFLTLFNADQMANFKPQADRQSFTPTFLAPLMYDQTFFKKLGGASAAEGMYGSNGSALFFSPEDAAAIPSVATFQKFYAQVSGGGAADSFAANAWASTALLVKALREAGPQVTREKVLAKLKATKKFDAEGFYAPSNPGDKKAGNCYVIWQIRGGKYVRTDSPAKGFRCDGKAG